MRTTMARTDADRCRPGRCAIVRFRLDLRLRDNPALRAALEGGGPVVPVYIWSPEEEGRWAPGAASRWWLDRSLRSLDEDLRRRGSRLIIRRGPPRAALAALVEETGAQFVAWSRRVEPAMARRDRELRAWLAARGVSVREVGGASLYEPGSIRSASGAPHQDFSAFWRACLRSTAPAPPEGAPRRIPAPRRWPASLDPADLGLEPEIDWAAGLRAAWRPGEAGARAALRRFLAGAANDYATGRDAPGRAGTSRLSPHLHFGEVSPRQVWHEVRRRGGLPARSTFLRELGWRELAHHLLRHFPRTPDRPLRPRFASFPWTRSPRLLRAWRRGRTGYPIVDAGMRELWHTGWMHNRARMIVASFLVKHLLVRWQDGAAWFWDTLVDADLANNTLGWQWSAGCGADAAPYFRIFNPVLQGAKFDPEGEYVRRWVPELARLPEAWIHRPWMAPETVRAAAGVELGRTYPAPIVDHAAARRRALEALSRTRARAP
jgi:deoxyribodipyrimidine photo-lyase